MHKKVIWVAVRLPGQAPVERAVTVRRFKAFWRSLQKMAAWLAELGVTDAAMESTGVYWWPVYHALARPGSRCACATRRTCATSRAARRTSGTASGSPSCTSTGCCGPASSRRAQVAALRQRTRYRKKLIEQRTSEGQRLAKVLEDAGIKIDSVASRTAGQVRAGR